MTKLPKEVFFRSGPQLPRDDQKFVFLILLPNIDFNLNARQDNNNNNTGLNMRPPVAECSLKGSQSQRMSKYSKLSILERSQVANSPT